MPLCTFADNYLMLGVTPVENLFIQEYLPRASGDYVRVYLYGLMQCCHPGEEMNLERMAALLGLSEEAVRDAFRYWERQGLVRRLDDKPTYQYLHIASTMLNESPMEQDIYRYRDFNNRLQQIFGNRLLHPAEFSMAAEWVEELKLPEAVVLIMVENYVAGHGVRCQFKSIAQTAARWAQEQIVTVELAREQALRESDTWKLCERILKRFSLRRKPTEDEVVMARKWLTEWELSVADVMAACTETVNARNPSFGYLDGILKRLTAATGGSELAGRLEEQKQIDDAIKRLHEELNQRNLPPSTSEQERYRRYLAAGFEPDTILRVARELAETMKSPDMQKLDEALTRFMERGQISRGDVETHLERQKALREQMTQVLRTCGLAEKRVTASDVALLEDWMKLADMDVILYAAECARGKTLPTNYIGKLLTDWKKLDLTSVALAKQHYEAGRPTAPGAQTVKPHAHNFQERTYQEGELDYLFDKMSKYDAEDEQNDAQ